MGKPGPGHAGSSLKGSEPGEVKHLSTQRKRKRSDSLSSGERNGNSLNLDACHRGVVGPLIRFTDI